MLRICFLGDTVLFVQVDVSQIVDNFFPLVKATSKDVNYPTEDEALDVMARAATGQAGASEETISAWTGGQQVCSTFQYHIQR